MTCTPPRFIADAMLGRLARWLRFAGYDTVYDTSLDDGELARLARETGRVLLTRDRELAGRRGITAYLVSSEQIQEQVAEVLRAFGKTGPVSPPRCAVCNGLLADAERESVQGKVPPHVWSDQAAFRVCRGCGRVYWGGTHWEGIRRGLEEARGTPRDR
ncbi:MAG: hypothetical protein HPY83_04255 [Anaerolineae bacterium]|nr:hypothetical protein [Anaerolineae bacterium]